MPRFSNHLTFGTALNTVPRPTRRTSAAMLPGRRPTGRALTRLLGITLALCIGAAATPAAHAQLPLPPLLGGNVTLDGSGSPLVLTGNSVIDASGVTVDLQFLVDYLVVAGGGGGASGGPGSAGGGGGAGGILTNEGLTGLPVDSRAYGIVVGQGGVGGIGGVGLRTAGSSGQDSVFGDIVSSGGGGGANFDTSAKEGGSGGGGAGFSSQQGGAAGFAGQGHAGGNGGGTSGNWGAAGGGGATAAGGNGATGVGGNGGDGLLSSLGGSAFYGGGGGGSTTNALGPQGLGGLGGGGNASRTGGNTNAIPNTGGGGGGGSNDTHGGQGGSGIVIVRYAGAPAATGGSVTQVGGNTIHTFTNPGAAELDFSALSGGRLSAHVAGDISGDGGIVYNGSGQITLAGDNTYSGGTVINGGAVQAASNTALGSGDVTINEGTLRLRPGVELGNDLVTGAGGARVVIDTNFTAEFLIAGGGGGGASGGPGSAGGGGGGGGVVTNIGAEPFAIGAESYQVTVGEGGAGGIGGAGLRTAGASGDNSQFAGITALGGGAAANFNTTAQPGGSGGGGAGWSSQQAGAAGFAGQGNPGGNGGGTSGNWGAAGGGGAAIAGANGATGVGGNGGDGLFSRITGSDRHFGGGGGGAANNASATQGLGGLGGGGNASRTGGNTDALANTGGGGGGGSNDTHGGQGGSGVVIVRYAGSPAATGGNITQADGFTIHEFTQTGAAELDFTAFDFESTLSGAISGSGGLTYNGPHTLRLTGQSSYQGDTRIHGGTLRLDGGDNRLPTGTDVILANNPGTRLDLNGTSQQLASLSGGGSDGGHVSLGAGQLTVAGPSSTVFHGHLDGTGGLTKSGPGHLTLAGDNSHSGGTTLAGGGLTLATPAAAGSGAITLNSGSLILPDGALDNAIVINGSAANVTLNNALSLDYLIVAGGGGGGSHTTGVGAGGGGAGGLLTNLGGNRLVLDGDTLSVIVGDGGVGSRANTAEPGANGGDSTLGDLIAIGGGGGAGGSFSQTGSPGGSGGGGRGNPGPGGIGVPGQGNPGGNGFPGGNGGGGGGGGAGGPGQDSPAVNLPGNLGFGGDGGLGRLSDITGIEVFYAGGGGAGASHPGLGGLGGGGDGIPSGTGGNGLPGTGGGGGGAGNGTGGQGGSGIVIVRYLGDPRAVGGTVIPGTGAAAGYTLHIFDTVGSHELDFSSLQITTELDGAISGSGGFTFEGPYSLILSGNNTYNGETIVNGGHMTLTGSHTSGSNSITAYLVNNGARLSLTNDATVNLAGSGGLRIVDGHLDMDSGSLRLGNWLTIGRDGGTGVFDMTGGTLTKAGGGGVSIGGVSGHGTLNLTGGSLNVQTGITQVGSNTNSTGLLLVGGDGRLIASAGMTVGEAASGDGSVRLMAGGTIDTPFLRGGAAANRALDWDGGTLRATRDESDFLSGLTEAAIGNAGAMLDTGGHILGISQDLGGTGGLGIRGGGVVTLSGDSDFDGDLAVEGTGVQLSGSVDQSGGTGAVDLDGGWLNLSSGARLTTAAITAHNGAILSGAGDITTSGNSTTIGSGSSLAPGDASLLGVGTLVLTTSSLTFEPGSFWELNIAGTANGRLQLDTPGPVDLGGADLIAGSTSFDFLTNTEYWLTDNVGGAAFTNFANLTSTSPAAGLFPDATGFVNLDGTSFAVFMNADFQTGGRTGGNDILLFATPEPSRALLAALGLAALLARRRR